MTEYISKWDVVDKLIALENEFQHFKPFEGFEHAMYRKVCEVEMEIGKTPGVTFHKWIPVSERLPEQDGKYLVFEQSGGRTMIDTLRFAKDARKIDRYDFGRRWKNAWYGYDSEWGHYTVNSVTHWMPLPTPPEGGCNET